MTYRIRDQKTALLTPTGYMLAVTNSKGKRKAQYDKPKYHPDSPRLRPWIMRETHPGWMDDKSEGLGADPWMGVDDTDELMASNAGQMRAFKGVSFASNEKPRPELGETQQPAADGATAPFDAQRLPTIMPGDIKELKDDASMGGLKNTTTDAGDDIAVDLNKPAIKASYTEADIVKGDQSYEKEVSRFTAKDPRPPLAIPGRSTAKEAEDALKGAQAAEGRQAMGATGETASAVLGGVGQLMQMFPSTRDAGRALAGAGGLGGALSRQYAQGGLDPQTIARAVARQLGAPGVRLGNMSTAQQRKQRGYGKKMKKKKGGRGWAGGVDGFVRGLRGLGPASAAGEAEMLGIAPGSHVGEEFYTVDGAEDGHDDVQDRNDQLFARGTEDQDQTHNAAELLAGDEYYHLPPSAEEALAEVEEPLMPFPGRPQRRRL